MKKESPDQRVETLLKKMTLREKASLLSGLDSWQTVPIERLGVPSLVMSDGPHGVRSQTHPTTCFPSGAGLGATWDPQLIERVGEVLGDETLASGADILLGPCVNIMRAPLAGRNFEAYSEDPFLAGRIGAAWIRGLQSRGAGASLKHFACNNQETERFRGNSVVDERTLREIYLPQFEAAAKEARPWTVMCAYNRINGRYASEHEFLLRQVLKGEWGFDGPVISDWGANHTVFDSIRGGLDLEMPGPAKYFGRLLEEAVTHWQIEESLVDDAARRILRMIVRSGRMDRKRPAGRMNTPAHGKLARAAAEGSVVLLKNEGETLPLQPGKLRRLAVIGPNAIQARIGGGGSSYVNPPYRVSPLMGLQKRLGRKVDIQFASGCDNALHFPVLSMEYVTTPDGSRPGLAAEFFANRRFAGKAVGQRTFMEANLWAFAAPREVPSDGFSLRLRWRLSVPISRRYRFAITHCHHVRLFVDGRRIINSVTPVPAAQPDPCIVPAAEMEMKAGKTYDVRLEFIKTPHHEVNALQIRMAPADEGDAATRIAAAAELAATCDAAIVFAGMPEGWETEGWDRPSMDLPGPQDDLIRAVAAANPKTIVVMHAGSPVHMPWIDQVPAALYAFYPGQEAGNAIAALLCGDISPSGKLPFSIPRHYEDNPAFGNFPGGRDVRYGEGIFVGYRYYDHKKLQPLFPFGHGLSYSTFAYGRVLAPKRAKIGRAVLVSLKVTNTGPCDAAEVVQLYVRDVAASVPRPPKELKAFAKIALPPGKSRIIAFTLENRAFAFWDESVKGWKVEPGEFEILVGSSSADLRAKATVTLE